MNTKACPICAGTGALLGCLGRTRHYRCVSCGWTFHHTPRPRRLDTGSLLALTHKAEIEAAQAEFRSSRSRSSAADSVRAHLSVRKSTNS